MKFWMKTAVAVSAMAMAGTAHAANLVSNGSFEDGNFSGGSFGFPLAQQVNPGDSSTLPGWTTGNAELAWFRSGQAGILTQDGDKALDLTGFFDTQGSYASVTQSIATLVGGRYRISFIGGTYAFNGNSPTAAGLRASGGATNGDFYLTPTGLSSGTWQSYQLDFIASATTTAIGFIGINDLASDPAYIGLDRVSVDLLQAPSGVPEPASWALMLGGFGLVGAALRSGNGRRRQRTVSITYA
jgi:hypothetical protein